MFEASAQVNYLESAVSLKSLIAESLSRNFVCKSQFKDSTRFITFTVGFTAESVLPAIKISKGNNSYRTVSISVV